MAKLTKKQEDFCNCYFETGNASEAYRRAYSSSSSANVVNVKASELLSNPKVSERIDELQAELKLRSDIKKERLLEELKAIAFADIRDYLVFDGKHLKFNPFDELTNEQAKAIESIKMGKYGIELKLHGKNWSIERICKMLGFDAPEMSEITHRSPFDDWSDEQLEHYTQSGEEPDNKQHYKRD
ncbi:terminase small subunit [Parabacteroides sp. Marseille-P3160]|uniref:terminase small subunit n=1 Tax=Parabacteroides sp. Marseille-P3160 TaxID=1917887 RepID=UPI0009BBB6DD|nr:terminase small subunit [Parabacteroides sp. Marseille-P3160]